MTDPDRDVTNRARHDLSQDRASGRWAWAEIDVDAVRSNVERLREVVAPSGLWAVVKANGYGHGVVDVARAALDGGADGLCVALVQEGVELRDAGFDVPILILSEQPVDAASTIVEHRLTPTVYSSSGVEAVAGAARAAGITDVAVHLKIDTGMQRVGVRSDAVGGLVSEISAHAPTLRLAGVFTHLAVADDPADPYSSSQLATLDAALESAALDRAVATGGLLVHAANSAGGLAHPDARRSFVRAGIAMYGISPGPAVDDLMAGLRPALSLRARVSFVKHVAAGSRISYGLRHTFATDTTVATVPIGYADGVPRRLALTGGAVLIGGRRRPIVGVVTMDQLLVDCGPVDTADTAEGMVAVGDEVVLIGEQDGPAGPQRIRAEDWADLLGTIGYEIVCGISGRVPRRPAP
ncbi:MAG: alanine racemase [Ilumatobacteraceae bacterium]